MWWHIKQISMRWPNTSLSAYSRVRTMSHSPRLLADWHKPHKCLYKLKIHLRISKQYPFQSQFHSGHRVTDRQPDNVFVFPQTHSTLSTAPTRSDSTCWLKGPWCLPVFFWTLCWSLDAPLPAVLEPGAVAEDREHVVQLRKAYEKNRCFQHVQYSSLMNAVFTGLCQCSRPST